MNIQSKMNALYPFAEIVMFCINTGVDAVYFGKRDMSEGGAKMRTKCHVFSGSTKEYPEVFVCVIKLVPSVNLTFTVAPVIGKLVIAS